jgi:pimeloyl-ACP methyl ester carboxylesterase
MTPQTRYANSNGLHIAYQVIGDGPLDLVMVPGFISHLEVNWEEPRVAETLERLASFSRLILMDKRGPGLSDPVPLDRPPTLEQRMEDLHAVLNAAGSERTALYGISEGGVMSMLFAATYPSRTTALVLYGTYAKAFREPDYPWGFGRESFYEQFRSFGSHWGEGLSLETVAPSLGDDQRFRAWWARYERMSASPGTAGALLNMAFESDLRHVLPTISVPTLVVHRSGDSWISVEHGRYLARIICPSRATPTPSYRRSRAFSPGCGPVRRPTESCRRC